MKNENPIEMSMSSPNTISGDGILDDSQKLSWLIANLAQSHQLQPSIPNVWNFRCSVAPYPAKHCDVLMTPSRILSNLFWQNLPSEVISNELKRLALLDCGCGKGIYFPIIDDSLGGVESYTGVDIKARASWSDFQKDPRVNFVRRGAEEIDRSLLEGKTLIVSQSALEHFPSDLTFFQNVADALRSRDYPTLQIHLLPTGTMWRQYGPHGFRGYVPANLKTILDMFKDFSRSHVFTLGGKHCLDVHYRYVHDTLNPEMPDRRRTHRDEYARATKAAMEADMASDQIDIMDACFLALVIHSHPQREIF